MAGRERFGRNWRRVFYRAAMTADMASEMRSCRRTACRWTAAASLSFRYATREVWLLDLSEDADPSLYDLCPRHADALTVPVGWERVDQRTSRPAVLEPAGRDLVVDLRESRARGAERPGNRYAELSRQLPRLAAAWASAARDLEAEARPDPRGTGEDTDDFDGDYEKVPTSVGALPQSPGQLAIPVERTAEGQDAVVVSIQLAGRRRGG